MLKLGITGSLGTGKSTVALMFKKLGAKIIDADKINHDILANNKSCIRKIIKAFGPTIAPYGRIDRRKLGEMVFEDRRRLKKLTMILHPAIIRGMKQGISDIYKKNKRAVVVIDAPLLIEAGFQKEVDFLIVVSASRKNQLKRIAKRMNIKANEAKKRIKAQMPLRDKINLADIVINNDGSLIQTHKQVREIWQRIQKKKQK